MNLNTINILVLVGKANKQKRLLGKDKYKTLESELHKLVGN